MRSTVMSNTFFVKEQQAGKNKYFYITSYTLRQFCEHVQVEILVINESNLNYQLLLLMILTVPPDMLTVFQLCNPSPSESDFQLHEILCQFWTVFPATTQILY
jgi:hypothetical protein